MAYIHDIATPQDFAAAEADGRIKVVAHPDPTVPYVIYNYSREAQAKRLWDDVTVVSRGLIVNTETSEVVARPFGKFFNYGEDAGKFEVTDFSGEVVVSDKLDGSLGVLYQRPDGAWAIATRGSFASDQAEHATALYNARYHGQWTPREDVTYLFEVIFKENRIVLDYGDMDDIVMLGAVHKDTGRSLTISEARGDWIGPVAKVLEFKSLEEVLTAGIPDDKEGVVIHFLETDQRLKVKGDVYFELARKITGMSHHRVWHSLMDGESLGDLLEDIPDEFEAPVIEVRDHYIEKFNAILVPLEAIAAEVKEQTKDGATASERFAIVKEKVSDRRDVGLVMSLIKGDASRVSQSLWRRVKPRGKKKIW